jgi:hypothetical protein
VTGAEAAEDPGRTRCTIGSRVTEASAGICSSGTPPRFSTDDETAAPSSVDLIAPAPSRRNYRSDYTQYPQALDVILRVVGASARLRGASMRFCSRARSVGTWLAPGDKGSVPAALDKIIPMIAGVTVAWLISSRCLRGHCAGRAVVVRPDKPRLTCADAPARGTGRCLKALGGPVVLWHAGTVRAA